MDVWNRNGSELKGLGFNLCVAPSCIVVSLILEGEGCIGDQRFGDDFIVKDRSQTKMTRREIVLEPVKLLVFGMHMQSPKSFYRDVTNKKRNLILCCSTTPEII